MKSRKPTLIAIALLVLASCSVLNRNDDPTSTDSPAQGRILSLLGDTATETWRDRIIGLPWLYDSDGRIVVSAHTQVSQRYQVPKNGQITAWATFLQGDGGYGCGGSTPNNNPSYDESTCYSMGDGGRIRLDVYADSGSPDYLPTGPSLAFFEKDAPLTSGYYTHSPVNNATCTPVKACSTGEGLINGSYFGFLPLSSPVSVTAGQILHFVFTNPDSGSELGNNYSIDFGQIRQVAASFAETQDDAVVNRKEWSVLVKTSGSAGAGNSAGYDTGGVWRDCNDVTANTGGTWCRGTREQNYWYTPMSVAKFADNTLDGNPYDYAPLGAQGLLLPVGTSPFGDGATHIQRQTFSITESTSIDSIAVKILPMIAGDAVFRIKRTSDNATMGTVTVPFSLATNGLDTVNCRYTVGSSGLHYDTVGTGISYNPVFSSSLGPTCSNNGRQITGDFSPDIVLAAGDYYIEFSRGGSARYAVQGAISSMGSSIWNGAGLPGGWHRSSNNGSSWTATGNHDAFAYLRITQPVGPPTTTTTIAPTTTTIPSAPAGTTGGSPSCASGIRLEAESGTLLGTVSPGSASNRVSWNSSVNSAIRWTPTLTFTSNWTFTVRYWSSGTSTRVFYQYQAPALRSAVATFPDTGGSWSTVDVSLNDAVAGSLEWSLSQDTGYIGNMAVDYVDACPATPPATTTTTTIPASVCPAGTSPYAATATGASNLTDNNDATLWTAPTTAQTSVVFDFGQSRQVRALAIYYAANRGAALFSVEVSNSPTGPWQRTLGRSWSGFRTLGGNRCFRGALNATGRYVRMTFARPETAAAGQTVAAYGVSFA